MLIRVKKVTQKTEPMKVILTLLLTFSFFFVLVKNSLAQSFEVAGTYTTSDANFYKNTPGVSFAYAYHFKKQFVFVEFKTSKKNESSFATFHEDIFGTYIIKSYEGGFSASSVNIGAAQKIVISRCLEFSAGADVGLNYYQPDLEITYIGLDKERNEIAFYDAWRERVARKNKFGIGAFIDMELKNMFFDGFSVFSRLNVYHSEYMKFNGERGVEFFMPFAINNVSFRLGVKYRISKAKE